VLADLGERILLISTTDRATDAGAIAIGRAALDVAVDALAGSDTANWKRGPIAEV